MNIHSKDEYMQEILSPSSRKPIFQRLGLFGELYSLGGLFWTDLCCQGHSKEPSTINTSFRFEDSNPLAARLLVSWKNH